MGLLITFFVFLASLSHEKLGVIASTQFSASTIWTREVSPRYDETSRTEINVEDLGPIILKVLVRPPFNYVVVGDDSTRIPHDIVEPGGWDHISPEEQFLSTKILDEYTIPLAFYHSNAMEPNSRFIVHCTENNSSTIAPAVVYEFQFDEDPELEIIAEAMDGWQHHYFFYEHDERAWKFVGKVACFNRAATSCKPDLSLNGFIGFEDYGWGTCFASLNMNYYTIRKDILIECFTVPAFVFIEMFNQFEPGVYHIEGSASPEINMNSIIVRVDEVAEYISDEPNDKLILKSQYSYTLSSTDGIHFTSSDKLSGFDSSSAVCAFFPEVNLGQKLMTLKKTGTVNQQKLLQGYDYDFVGYTR